jgi:hypothetical protein
MLPLTVIIPSYNRAALLNQTLQSLMQQSCSDFHTMVVDHGSTDQTTEVAQNYMQRLHLSYYQIAHDDYAPGIPRDVGVRRADTPLIAFLDSGAVVPSWYVEAHLAFHRLHCNHVGLGLVLGLQYRKGDSGIDEVAWPTQQEIDQADSHFHETSLRDVREGLDLAHSSIPWYYGWTANLSLPTEAYFAAGGFDTTLTGWGFEDVDLSYRLFKHGLPFAFVADGWSLELPQPRQPLPERLESGQRNMRQCYAKQRSLALESLLLAALLLRQALTVYRTLPTTTPDSLANLAQHMRSHFQFLQHAEAILSYLSQLGHERRTRPPLPAHLNKQERSTTLYIGGTARDATHYKYVTLADESCISTASLWSCCGILLPLADQSLETVVVSDIWQHLDWALPLPFDLPRVSLLDVLLSEIQRTAKQAVFLHTPASNSQSTHLSVETLVSLCQRRQMAFQIVSAA